MTPRGLLERLVDFERRIHRVYLRLGDQTTFPADLRFFWNAMAEEECHHLAILERSAGLLDLRSRPSALMLPYSNKQPRSGQLVANSARTLQRPRCTPGRPYLQ